MSSTALNARSTRWRRTAPMAVAESSAMTWKKEIASSVAPLRARRWQHPSGGPGVELIRGLRSAQILIGRLDGPKAAIAFG
jgi:hypothetical protein